MLSDVELSYRHPISPVRPGKLSPQSCVMWYPPRNPAVTEWLWMRHGPVGKPHLPALAPEKRF